MTERGIIERFGFTIQGLKIIKFIWEIKFQALKIERAMSNGLPEDAYVGFEPLVDAFVQTIVGRGALRKTSKSNPTSSAGNNLPPQTYGSKRVAPAVANRKCRVLKGRLGWLDGRRWTLEELGQSEDLIPTCVQD